MPKINVYLPDELAEAVKDAGIPVSAICQRALEQAVRRVTALRETTQVRWDEGDPTAGFTQLTERARTVVRLATEQARAAGATTVGTGHLLAGLLAEGGNMALLVLRAVELEPDRIAVELANRSLDEPGPDAAATGQTRLFSAPASAAMQFTLAEALGLGNNYIGCEHLLLGLLVEPDGVAGQVLRAAGADPRLIRRATAAALASYVHLHTQMTAQQAGTPDVAAAVRQELQPLVRRIERLEERLDATEGHA